MTNFGARRDVMRADRRETIASAFIASATLIASQDRAKTKRSRLTPTRGRARPAALF